MKPPESHSNNNPKTPKLSQEEFGLPPNIFQNSNAPAIDLTDTVNTDPVKNSQQETEPTTVKTPLTLNIPTFDTINALPTPMTYTPLSPNLLSSMSPTIQMQQQPFQQLNIKKRRNNNNLNNINGINTFKSHFNEIRNSKELDQVKNIAASNRVVSELIPPPTLSPQRIVSLPTVNEEEITFDNEERTKLENEQNEFSNEEIILNGYLLKDMSHVRQWKKIKHIGTGNFSFVTLYESLDEFDKYYHQVAVKKIKYPNNILNTTDDTLSRLESSLTRELSVLKTLDHPCVVKLYGINNPIFIEQKRPLTTLLQEGHASIPSCEFIMSYCNGGDLLKELTECQGNVPRWLIQRLYGELVLAVKYLHENLIIHRDLKLENILLRYTLDEIIGMRNTASYYEQNMIELGDFGLCKKIENGELCTARCGSEDYVSPEILMGIPYNGNLTDTWALGVILYALLEDRLPFDAPPNANQRQRNRPVAHRIARFEWRWSKTLDEVGLDSAKDIVKNTLTRKNQRWNIQQMYDSDYIKEVVGTLKF
ncbi:similar to Saccharomyces cerevisiae YKL116C PRR1 Serine/threonine protein kinase that inhibits pheromone induced signalling downstream of MAPK [Maudiozyma saulgeensis]|uniref:Similar to Saccharomyces cerevisiae YKL116C PRR1 Serine/threonine protein kinase that inhibits pheromone induced signalling downstream of MAPK n=1 Tax=Maudiozyma saulgeensis TaxID=1789683 RepID=A0A1X7R075_9SACH|nr:similar to Saccharomyces cerevisiae YKL116C PRR1 Serine/threonine protein kinase that inhibits pheromone induced signalling downstream of MAPK [Kazachstania saulgeensis]